MAEALGIVASIIAIVELSAKSCHSIKGRIDSVQNAPQLLRSIRNTASSVEALLNDMRSLGNERLAASESLKKALAIPNGDVEACKRELEGLDKLLETYIDDAGPSASGKRRKWMAKIITWPRTEEKAKKHLQEIEQYRKNIHMALQIERRCVPQPNDTSDLSFLVVRLK